MIPLDTAISESLNGLVGAWDALDWFVTFSARYFLAIATAVAIAAMISERRWRSRIWVAAVAVLSVILSRGIIAPLIHLVVPRQRPFEVSGFVPITHADPGNAFPSGHASFLFALSFALFFYLRSWGWWLLGLSLINGAARVMAGAHWAGDILGGMIVGLLSAFAVRMLLAPYKPPAEPPPEPATSPPPSAPAS